MLARVELGEVVEPVAGSGVRRPHVGGGVGERVGEPGQLQPAVVLEQVL